MSKEQKTMQKPFKCYYNTNQLCLKLVLLPFTVTFWVIKKLVQATHKRYTTKKN